MQTRHKSNTQQTPPRTAEVQKQIEDDAKLAKRISMLTRSPTKKESNGRPRSQERKSSITIRRLAFGRGAGLKGPWRKDASIKMAQAQASDISAVAAVEQSQVHSEDSSSSGEQEQELEATPRSATKRLRSLFKGQTKAQGADKMEEAGQAPVIATDVSEPVGEARANIMKGNIAQSIPPHLRQKFAAETVASIRRLVLDGIRTHVQSRS